MILVRVNAILCDYYYQSSILLVECQFGIHYRTLPSHKDNSLLMREIYSLNIPPVKQ